MGLTKPIEPKTGFAPVSPADSPLGHLQHPAPQKMRTLCVQNEYVFSNANLGSAQRLRQNRSFSGQKRGVGVNRTKPNKNPYGVPTTLSANFAAHLCRAQPNATERNRTVSGDPLSVSSVVQGQNQTKTRPFPDRKRGGCHPKTSSAVFVAGSFSSPRSSKLRRPSLSLSRCRNRIKPNKTE
jgi:hypothetical protein